VSKTLNELVREQILAEGPDLPSEQDWTSQSDYEARRELYIDEQLDSISNAELLERISDQLDGLLSVSRLSVRLGL
jgi:hypothetical protein